MHGMSARRPARARTVPIAPTRPSFVYVTLLSTVEKFVIPPYRLPCLLSPLKP